MYKRQVVTTVIISCPELSVRTRRNALIDTKSVSRLLHLNLNFKVYQKNKQSVVYIHAVAYRGFYRVVSPLRLFFFRKLLYLAFNFLFFSKS